MEFDPEPTGWIIVGAATAAAIYGVVRAALSTRPRWQVALALLVGGLVYVAFMLTVFRWSDPYMHPDPALDDVPLAARMMGGVEMPTLLIAVLGCLGLAVPLFLVKPGLAWLADRGWPPWPRRGVLAGALLAWAGLAAGWFLWLAGPVPGELDQFRTLVHADVVVDHGLTPTRALLLKLEGGRPVNPHRLQPDGTPQRDRSLILARAGGVGPAFQAAARRAEAGDGALWIYFIEPGQTGNHAGVQFAVRGAADGDWTWFDPLDYRDGG